METPKQYAQRILESKNNMKGLARIFISNLLYLSSVKTTRDFYSDALKELDLI